jgi:hypothetical protein
MSLAVFGIRPLDVPVDELSMVVLVVEVSEVPPVAAPP